MSGLINSAGSRSGVIGETELDYEEGTFTATFVHGNQESTTGVYTKVGRLVQVAFNFESKTISSTSGTGVQVSGMPFTAREMSPAMYNGAISTKNFDYSSGSNVQPFMTTSTTTMQFSTSGDSTIIGGLNYIDGGDRYLRVSCSYFTDTE